MLSIVLNLFERTNVCWDTAIYNTHQLLK